MLPGRKRASGPDSGRTATWKASKSALGLALGQPGGPIRRFLCSSPAKILPGSPLSGLEAPLRNIGYIGDPVDSGSFAKLCASGIVFESVRTRAMYVVDRAREMMAISDLRLRE